MFTISVFFLLIMLFVTACNPEPAAGERVTDTAAALQQLKTGTQGVEISFLQDTPPAQVYDQNELVAIVEVKNKGNQDLGPQDCFVQVTGFDKNILRGGFDVVRFCGDDGLDGRNVYNLEGSSNFVEFRTTSIDLPNEVFDYNPTLNFVTCYQYGTSTAQQVCLDPQFYQVSAQQKACRPQNIGAGGGQGGPVGVGSIGVEMVGSKAIFEINVQQYGTGRVLSPNTDIRNCASSTLDYTDFDRVGYNVRLGRGSTVSDCKPGDGYVRLNNGHGKIVCTFPISGSVAYETPLLIDLDYGIISSQQKNVRIIKTPE